MVDDERHAGKGSTGLRTICSIISRVASRCSFPAALSFSARVVSSSLSDARTAISASIAASTGASASRSALRARPRFACVRVAQATRIEHTSLRARGVAGHHPAPRDLSGAAVTRATEHIRRVDCNPYWSHKCRQIPHCAIHKRLIFFFDAFLELVKVDHRGKVFLGREGIVLLMTSDRSSHALECGCGPA